LQPSTAKEETAKLPANETSDRSTEEDSTGDLQPSTSKLDFLSDIPEFHQLHLDITEDELKSLIAANDLLVTMNEIDGEKSYHVYRSDGENVIVMFRDGNCAGVQRMQRDVSEIPKHD